MDGNWCVFAVGHPVLQLLWDSWPHVKWQLVAMHADATVRRVSGRRHTLASCRHVDLRTTCSLPKEWTRQKRNLYRA
eukprot:6251633-Alexandrium_andersonii.AAC.1